MAAGTDRPTSGAAHNPRLAARPCPDAARSAPRSSATRFARHAAPNRIESLQGFPSDGDDVGDAAAGESFLPSFLRSKRERDRWESSQCCPIAAVAILMDPC
jgi:hypothetical protein